jgi:hypothetical protein
MVICPIALAVGCRKCPIFAVCPVKSVIGDFKPNVKDIGTPLIEKVQAKASPAAKPKAKKKPRAKTKKKKN